MQDMAQPSHTAFRDAMQLEGYRQLLEQMRFNISRRISLANSISGETKKALTIWIGLFGAAKALSADYKSAHAILDALVVWVPIFGMIECIAFMAIARSVFQDENNYTLRAVQHEDDNEMQWGPANIRYNEVVDATFWRPATTEAAGIIGLSIWSVCHLVARYYI